MHEEVSKLILYRDEDKSSILCRLGEIFYQWEHGGEADAGRISKLALADKIYGAVKGILELATDFGFDDNLWQNYLTFVLITHENPFSITCEKVGASAGASVNQFAKNDCGAFWKLFHYDFSGIEKDLDITCFSILSDYRAVVKKELMYNKNVSEKVRALSGQLAQAADEDEFFDMLAAFYRAYGVGMFGLNKAFRIFSDAGGGLAFRPINNMDAVLLDDLVGYEIQKRKLTENTEAFVAGKKANNVLLFGDSGTGKSTSIKAVVNQYYDRGLRMIEIYKHQFKDLSDVIARIKNRNYKFIIYMDDLSFEDFEIEYKFLKAVIEGGVETRPENILIYATSNRRHLIRENWSDRSDMEHREDMHHSDTMEEKLSLVNRFGVTIGYSKPSQKEYFHIVCELAKKNGIVMPKEALCAEAVKWELSHGGISGRTAQQFVNYMAARQEPPENEGPAGK